VKAALGRIALVTGAGQSIGRAIACQLARDGCDISIVDIPSAKPKVDDVIKEIQSYDRMSVGACANMREQKQIYAAVEDPKPTLDGAMALCV